MKPEVLQLSPILIPEINARLSELFTVRRYFEQADKAAYVQEHGANIRGVITGGHTGISQALMAQLPKLEVVAVNGVLPCAFPRSVEFAEVHRGDVGDLGDEC